MHPRGGWGRGAARGVPIRGRGRGMVLYPDRVGGARYAKGGTPIDKWGLAAHSVYASIKTLEEINPRFKIKDSRVVVQGSWSTSGTPNSLAFRNVFGPVGDVISLRHLCLLSFRVFPLIVSFRKTIIQCTFYNKAFSTQ